MMRSKRSFPAPPCVDGRTHVVQRPDHHRGAPGGDAHAGSRGRTPDNRGTGTVNYCAITAFGNGLPSYLHKYARITA